MRNHKGDILILFLLSLAINFFFFNSLVTDDSLTYMELTENLALKHQYATPVLNELQGYTYKEGIDPELHSGVPPLYPLVSVPFYWMTGNAMQAIKLSTYLFSALTIIIVYLFTFRLSRSRNKALLASLLVMFNPVFFYYAGVLPLTEALALFLITLGVYIFTFYKAHPLAGLCFGLATLTRYMAGAFLLTYSIYYGLELLKGKKVLRTISFAVLGYGPLVLWLIVTYLMFGTFNPVAQGVYSGHFSGRWVHAGHTLLILVGGFIFMFSLLIPWVIKTVKDSWKPYLYFYISAIILFLTPLILLDQTGVPFLTATISYSRLLLPIFPLLIIFTVSRLKVKTGVVAALAFVTLTLVANVAPIKDVVDTFIPLPELRTQKVYQWNQAIKLVNENVPYGMQVTYRFGDPAFDNVNLFFENYLREDLVYVPYAEAGELVRVIQ